MFGNLFRFQSGGRKTRSNKGVKRRPYGRRTGKTRSGKRFRPVAAKRTVRRSTRSTSNRPVRRTRKQRSNKGVKRGPYGRRTGRTRSGRRFRQAVGGNGVDTTPGAVGDTTGGDCSTGTASLQRKITKNLEASEKREHKLHGLAASMRANVSNGDCGGYVGGEPCKLHSTGDPLNWVCGV
jgi:hypothetical protein